MNIKTKMKPGEVTVQLERVESAIREDGHSNRLTAYYYAVLSYYYYCGGRGELQNRLTKSGILKDLPTAKAQESYIKNARVYILAGLTILNLEKCRRRHDIHTANPQHAQLLLIDISNMLSKYCIVVDRHIGNNQINLSGPGGHIIEVVPSFQFIWELEDWLSSKVVKASACEDNTKRIADSIDSYYYEQVRYVASNRL